MGPRLRPDNTLFCILAFEGPDPYASAGGLGVRVSHLAETLARRGFETHLIFIGDPAAPGRETRLGGRLVLHRWCQWMSAYHPGGVYDGEEGKWRDYADSLPSFLIEHIIRPALAAGRLPVILAEEWHTAEALIRLSDLLHGAGVRQRCVLFWNANNTMGFHRIDWPRLNYVAQLTTVSRYMKHIMHGMGLDPLVIPNGIPSEDLQPVDAGQIAALRSALNVDGRAIMLFKAARFDPAKRWVMAMEVAARLKAEGCQIVFPCRGGVEPHGADVVHRARGLGLDVTDVWDRAATLEDLLAVLRTAPPADVYNLRFPLSQGLLRVFYAAADAVLAMSAHEPFGLVGLEAMAAGGLVFLGSTGEEYALGGQGAVVVETDRPDEVAEQVLSLHAAPRRARAIRCTARTQAAQFTWNRVHDILLDKVAFVGHTTGALPPPGYDSRGVHGRERAALRHAPNGQAPEADQGRGEVRRQVPEYAQGMHASR